MLNRSIYEDGNGGSYLLREFEIIQTESIAVLAYLKMFGGNVEEVTKTENNTSELRSDWWGNDSTLPSNTWINSKTEKLLRGLSLTNKARYDLINAVKEDLKSLEEYGTIDVQVNYPNLNRVDIIITITEPSKKSSNRLLIAWDATKNEIIENQII